MNHSTFIYWDESYESEDEFSVGPLVGKHGLVEQLRNVLLQFYC